MEIKDRGHALTIDSGWREVADTALAFVSASSSFHLRMATGSATITAEERPLLAAARAGDEAAFAARRALPRRAARATAYRMLGSVHDAEDALQEALLRAWRGLARFEGRSSLRSWLYTIATNTSLNLIERRPKRVLPIDYGPAADPHGGPGEPLVESVWIEPYPDERWASRTGWPPPRRATSSARASSWPSSPRCSTCPPPSAPC